MEGLQQRKLLDNDRWSAKVWVLYGVAETLAQLPHSLEHGQQILPRNTTFTNVEFIHPDAPKDFQIVEDTAANTDIKTAKNGARIKWHTSGTEWPHGSEENAKNWAADRTCATFTDPSGINWKLDGHRNFTEITRVAEEKVHS